MYAVIPESPRTSSKRKKKKSNKTTAATTDSNSNKDQTSIKIGILIDNTYNNLPLKIRNKKKKFSLEEGNK